MFDALWMFNFLLCCLFAMKRSLWTVLSKLQHWNTEKLFFHKQALNHVWCTLGCPIFAVLSIWDEINIVDSFQQVATLKYWKKLVLHKQALNHVWFTLYVQFFALLSIWDEMNIVNSFQQVATLKYRKNIFCINKL